MTGPLKGMEQEINILDSRGNPMFLPDDCVLLDIDNVTYHCLIKLLENGDWGAYYIENRTMEQIRSGRPNVQVKNTKWSEL